MEKVNQRFGADLAARGPAQAGTARAGLISRKANATVDRINRACRIAWIIGIVFAGQARPGNAAPPRAANSQARPADRMEDVNTVLGLKTSSIVRVSVPDRGAPVIKLTVPVEEAALTLDLKPNSVRSDRFEVRVPRADGSYQNIEPGPPRTYRGTVSGIAGSAVAASLLDDGWYVRILLPGAAGYWVEPLARHLPAASRQDHVVYRDNDVLPTQGTCQALRAVGMAERTQSAAGPASPTGSGIVAAQIAIDADFEFFNASGTVAAASADIESIINAMNLIYERDVSITHVITTILVRTSEPDPYPSNDPVALLCDFRDEWNGPQAGIPRDTAHLFTGKNVAGNTIGIAFIRVLCNESGFSPDCGGVANVAYGLSESRFTSNFSFRVALTTHEVGHNWNADHCDDLPDCHIMCSVINGCDGLAGSNLRFGSPSVSSISNFRSTRTCLDSEQLLSLAVQAPSNTVSEAGTLQLAATAQFLVGPDRDVTTEAVWWVNPPGVGFVSPSGLFAPFNVSGDTCATIGASYDFGTTTRSDETTILVLDQDVPRQIVGGDPPPGAVDARQPTDPDGTNPSGWRLIELTFNGDTCLMTAGSLVIGEDGGTGGIPSIDTFEQLGPRRVRVLLSEPIEPGAWTTITETGTGASMRLGFLPDDVDANGLVDPSTDLPALRNALLGLGGPLPAEATDLDRSGRTTPADLLRFVDLIGGADAFDAWLGRTLPP